MNITVDDTSPLFQYVSVNASAPWEQDSATNSNDEKIAQYYGSTMAKTTGEGNYMSYTFNGTAIYIYGSKRENHGAYSDGADPVVQLGRAPAPGVYQQLLFSAGDLDTGKEHEVRVTNVPSQTPENGDKGVTWLDIDYVVLTVALPELNAPVFTTRIDDTSPDCRYTGESWSTDTPMNAPEYHNSTAHITHSPKDTMVCNFNGTSVEVLGGLMTDHSNYSVSIDDEAERIFNGSYHTIMPQTTLFAAGQLSDGPHIIRLTNLQPDLFFDFDCLVVNSTIAPPVPGNDTVAPVILPTNAISNKDDSNTENHDQGTPPLTLKGSIGITAGIVLGTALLLLLAHLGWRWRHKSRSRKRPEGIDRIKQIDLTGEEIRPFTSVSPITMYNDTKYLYSPANPTPLWTGAAFPTPLRSAAAFFPYAPPSTAGTSTFGSFASPFASSSFSRARGHGRGTESDATGVSDSETGTFGDIPILPCLPPPAARRSSRDGGEEDGSTSGHSGASESTLTLLKLYNNARAARASLAQTPIEERSDDTEQAGRGGGRMDGSSSL